MIGLDVDVDRDYEGPHGRGWWVHWFSIDDDSPPGSGTIAYKAWETTVPRGTLIYLFSVISGFWPSLGFSPVFAHPPGVEWFDEGYAPVEYWNDVMWTLVKRVVGGEIEPLVVTPSELGY